MKKILIIIGIIVLLIIIGLFIYLHTMSIDMKPKEITALFQGKKYQLLTKTYSNTKDPQTPNITTREIGGNDSLPLVIFVHGSPGGWDAFAHYLADNELQGKIRMVSVDRLGYGGSNKGKPEMSLAKQADILKPIIARFAMDFPVGSAHRNDQPY